jgi:hypothetical protein
VPRVVAPMRCLDIRPRLRPPSGIRPRVRIPLRLPMPLAARWLALLLTVPASACAFAGDLDRVDSSVPGRGAPPSGSAGAGSENARAGGGVAGADANTGGSASIGGSAGVGGENAAAGGADTGGSAGAGGADTGGSAGSGGADTGGSAGSGGDPDVCEGLRLPFNGDTAHVSDTTARADAHHDYVGTCGTTGEAPDLVFRVEAPKTGLTTVSLAPQSWDAVLYIRFACDGLQVQCADAGSAGNVENISFHAQQGSEYWIFVDGGVSGQMGPFELTVSY